MTPRVPEKRALRQNSRGPGPPTGSRTPYTIRTPQRGGNRHPARGGPEPPHIRRHRHARGVGGTSGCTVCLGNARSTVQPGKSHLGLCCDRVHLTPPALNAVGGRVFPMKPRSRARACACGYVEAPDPPGGVSVPSPLRGPDSIWGSGTPWGVRSPRLFWLSAPFSGTCGVTEPFPSKGRVRGR